MAFIWPVALLSLVLVPLLAVLFGKIQQRRHRFARQFGTFGFGQGSSGQEPGFRSFVPVVLFLAGLTILLVALARPQAVVNMPKLEGTLILAFDVSGSMAAEDFSPNRMEAAKKASLDLVERLPAGVQVGIVAFSDGGFSVQAPTDDQEEITATINRLTPERGTSLAQGILAALNAITKESTENAPESPTSSENELSPELLPNTGETYESATIVLISDGENNMNPDPLEAAQTAAQLGVRIDTVGIGSPSGASLNIDGFMIHTKLDEEMLQGISHLTGGEYYRAADETELQNIYENLAPKLVIEPEKMEITSLLVGAGLLAFLFGGLFSLLWFSRIP